MDQMRGDAEQDFTFLQRFTATAGLRSSTRICAARASITAVGSGAGCSPCATSARISERRCCSRDATVRRVASSKLPIWPDKIVAFAARSSLKKSGLLSCKKTATPTTSPETMTGAPKIDWVWYSAAIG